MKRLLIVLILIPSFLFGAYTEFYAQNGGNNLNAGSTTNNTASYTSTGGNWTNTTRIFTVTDGTNPSSSITAGDFCSVYVTAGATVATFVGRVSSVQNATNGTVTFSTNFAGSNPSNGTGTMTLKNGGAWGGPTGATTFPFALSNENLLVNTNNDPPRFNFKNDQTITVTAALSFANSQAVTVQGYSSSVADGGKTTFTSNITSAANFSCNATGTTFTDLIFINTGASNANDLFSSTGAGNVFTRCVFHGARANGLVITGSGFALESEAYDCNKSNTASKGGFNVTGSGSANFINCYSHDHASGSNAHGFVSGVATSYTAFQNVIADTCAGSGLLAIQSTGSNLTVVNSDFYNNTGDGIKITNSGSPNGLFLITNCNFIKNGGKGINVATTGSPISAVNGFSYNNGYGAGTQANGSSDTLSNLVESGKITYASNITPWNAPTTGDFTLVSTNTHAGYNAGRGHFEETDGTNTGTVGYPDIGAANHNDTCGGTGPCQTSGASSY